MKRFLPLFLFLVLGADYVHAQQDPMYTSYMFNSLVYNPAYAGSREHLSIVALYRDQWVGWNDGLGDEGGAPTTQNFTLHSPIGARVAAGLSLVHDQIGARTSSSANLAYAYRIPFGKGKLSLGVQGGIQYWKADWDALNFKDPRELDNAFVEEINQWIPNVGAGAYYYSDYFYAGFSVPNLVSYNLRETFPDGGSGPIKWAQAYRHYYITTGAAIPLKGDDLIFKPSLLIKSVGLFGDFSANQGSIKEVATPTEFDIDASLFFFNTFWVGLSYRSAFEALLSDKSSHDSVDIWMALFMKNGLRIGAAYDFSLTQIQNYSVGSIELLIGYDFDYKVEKTYSPRYF